MGDRVAPDRNGPDRGEPITLRRCPKCKRLTERYECCYVKGPPLIPQLDDYTSTVPVKGVFIPDA